MKNKESCLHIIIVSLNSKNTFNWIELFNSFKHFIHKKIYIYRSLHKQIYNQLDALAYHLHEAMKLCKLL